MLNWLRIGHLVDGGSSLCDEINPGFALESLESRILLAAQVPTDYVKINSAAIAVQSQSPTPTQTGITLHTGQNYYLVASGTHDLTRDGRLADAQFYQRSPDLQWVTGSKPHLRVTGVSSWGAYQSDHEYGVHLVGNGAELAPWINDSYYSDNSGFLYLDVYQQVPEFVNSTDDDADLDLNDGTAWTGQFTPEGFPEVTLRSLIQHSNATEGRQIVGFNIPGGGVHVITPNGALPTITDATDVDGTTQPGYSNNSPVIQINGQGLVLQANDSSILGLSIVQAPAAGVAVTGNQNTIHDNHLDHNQMGVRIGGGASDNIVRANTIRFSSTDGVVVNGASNNIIGGPAASDGNLIVTSDDAGVTISGAATDNSIAHNTIGNLGAGNRIGVLILGGSSNNSLEDNTIHYNDSEGVLITNAADNTIGGENHRNLIRENGIGVRLTNNAVNIVIVNNLIEDHTGDGIVIEDGSATRIDDGLRLNDIFDNDDGIVVNTNQVFTIGGPAPAADGNDIRGGQRGIAIEGAGEEGITIQGNNIHDASVVGIALRSQQTANDVLINTIHDNAVGIGIENESRQNQIGSGNPADVNTIQGNGTGIIINGDGTDANVIFGNSIVSNDGHGIVIQADADGNEIRFNEIEDNVFYGVLIQGSAEENIVWGNHIAGNESGVVIFNARNNTVSDGDGAAGNIIEANAFDGVRITGAGATGNRILHNLIQNNATFGLDSSDGVQISNGASDNEVDGNEIRDNSGHGVNIDAAGSNRIGTGNGNLIASNGAHGVRIFNANSNQIVNNTLEGNTLSGVDIRDTAVQNEVRDNLIRFNMQNGVEISSSSDTNRIRLNQISQNAGDGLRIDSGSSGNIVTANGIGDNGGDAVRIDNAPNNRIGEFNATDFSNAINGNGGYGIRITGSTASGNVIEDNHIDAAFDGVFIGAGAHDNSIRINTIRGNLNGVHIVDAPNNAVGGVEVGNLIATSGGAGVRISGEDATGNRVQGNNITSNGSHGIFILNGSSNSLIGTNEDGTDDAAEINSMLLNAGNGVAVESGTGNRVAGNTYAGNGLLAIDIGNDGLTANDADDDDTGANNLQNTPVLTNATLSSGDLSVIFLVDSTTANAMYPMVIEIYRNDNGLLQWIGSTDYMSTDAQTSVTAVFTPLMPISTGDEILAIAIDSEGNTSELSNIITVV